MLEPEAVTGLELDRAARHAAEARIDDLDGVGRTEELLDIGFAKEERHGAG